MTGKDIWKELIAPKLSSSRPLLTTSRGQLDAILGSSLTDEEKIRVFEIAEVKANSESCTIHAGMLYTALTTVRP